jgi:DNA topoisomerase-1
MLVRWSKNGEFLACSGYPACKNTKEFKKNERGEIEIIEPKKTKESCEKCGKTMLIKKGRFGEFLACSGYPKCRNTKPLPLGVDCPDCGGQLVRRKSLKGKFFFGCSNYPKCNYTTRFLKKEDSSEQKKTASFSPPKKTDKAKKSKKK